MTSILLLATGETLGVLGICVAVYVAPWRGDWWGYFGIILVMVGFIVCYFAGGFVKPEWTP